MEMVKLTSGLLTEKYTTVHHEKDFSYNAPHHFEVRSEDGVLATIHFQEGPIKEAGINGVNNEDLINMVIARLEGFQNSTFKCRENALAITKLEESLLWLRKRTMDREARGVEGTHTV
jgi:hypothetical protein